MKKFFKVFLIAVLGLSISACSQKVEPIKEYYALTSVFYSKTGSETIYMTDQKKFDQRINELNDLIKASSQVELEEADQETQQKLTKSANALVKQIKKTRTVNLQSIKKEKNGDYSLVDKSNKALKKYDNAEDDFFNIYNTVTIERERTDRIIKMDEYSEQSMEVNNEINRIIDYRHTITSRTSEPSSKELKNLTKKIAVARKNVDKLKAIEVDEADMKVKEEKEKAMYDTLDLLVKSKKHSRSKNTYKNNMYTQKFNVMSDKIYHIDLYYYIDVEPYLPKEESK
ncbi:Na+/phosphate symporter [Bacilli bacterium PM5-9]|nr:Na+/phosphate symporter [Bacilli bacterium PM5-9]